MNLKRTLIIDCLEKVGEDVLLRGWVHVVRSHGKIAFLDLRDRTGLIQVGSFEPELSKKFSELSSQDVVEIKGKVKERGERYINPHIPTGTIEVEASDVSVLSEADEMPFDMGGPELNLELPTLLDYRSLTLRHPRVAAVFKIQETVALSFRNTLSQHGFTEIYVPTIVPTATEGGAEVFPLEYYDKKAYLAQSPQFYKQIMVGIFERVFTIAHAYRAEPSVTTRHLSEYVSLDAEMGYIESFEEIMDVVEDVIKNFIKDIKTKHKDDLKLLGIELPEVSAPIPRIKMREAQKMLFETKGIDHRSEPDLDPGDEKALCEWAQETTGAPFVFVTHFPVSKRPFYTMPDSDDPEYTLSFDLLGIAEEWVTGGQRVHSKEMLLERIKEKGNSPENFDLYLKAFSYGMPPEGGFAMGLERITKDFLSLSNVREASLFPRDMERIDERLSKKEEK